MRLNKYIADAGLCSRRGADRLIAAGAVTINGRTAVPGDIVNAGDKVSVDGQTIKAGDKEKVVVAFHKPPGYVCTAQDRHAGRTIYDIFDYPLRLTYAGRLDKDSEGLLLMTNDGRLIERMMRGSHGHEKAYHVRVDTEITPVMIKKMTDGVYLPELDIRTRPCRIEGLGPKEFNIILTQGVNKQIRRMCKTVGLRVKSLKRLRVLNIELANLQAGEFRRIEGGELEELYRRCGLVAGEKA